MKLVIRFFFIILLLISTRVYSEVIMCSATLDVYGDITERKARVSINQKQINTRIVVHEKTNPFIQKDPDPEVSLTTYIIDTEKLKITFISDFHKQKFKLKNEFDLILVMEDDVKIIYDITRNYSTPESLDRFYLNKKENIFRKTTTTFSSTAMIMGTCL